MHDNVIRRVGGAGELYQQQGLQIGAYTSCEVRRNILSDGPANGIIVLDAADALFADNVIARFAGSGVYANLRALVESASWRLVHNTIVGPGEAAIRIFGAGVEAVAWNNFVIAASGGESSIAASGEVGFEAADNVFAASIEEAGVAGPDDFHLSDGSPARGAGRDLRAMGFATDLDGRPRASPPSVGAYEHETDAPVLEDAGIPNADAAVPGADAGQAPSDAGPADAGTSGAAGGCGCRAAGASSSAPWIALCALLGLLSQRRRSSSYVVETITRSASDSAPRRARRAPRARRLVSTS